MKFFLDNMISVKFARALREVERQVVALRERFAEDTPDRVWLTEIAKESPVLITLDRHIRSRPLERIALSHAGIISLFLGPFFSKKSFPFWEQFVWLVKHWTMLEHTAKGLGSGTCMLVTQSGKMYPMPKS